MGEHVLYRWLNQLIVNILEADCDKGLKQAAEGFTKYAFDKFSWKLDEFLEEEDEMPVVVE